jgi:hypothetical protein
VEVLPLRTAISAQLGVFVAYWAPRASFPALAPELANITSCYAPERATLFRLFRNVGPFTFAMPPGFRVTSLSQDYLQVKRLWDWRWGRLRALGALR